MEEKKGIIFQKRMFVTGGSLALIISPELLDFLEVEEATKVELSGYEGKHGKFVALWKKK